VRSALNGDIESYLLVWSLGVKLYPHHGVRIAANLAAIGKVDDSLYNMYCIGNVTM